MKNRPFAARLGYALNGLVACWRSEASFRAHCAAGSCAISLLLLTRAPPLWWALVALAVGGVLAAELLNSALERLADRVHPGRDPLIGQAKDMAAGGVLAAAIAAIVVAAALLAASCRP